MDIFITSNNRNITCDIAPINSRTPVHPQNSNPTSIAYNSAIYVSNNGSSLYIFLIFNQNPTNLKYEGSSISSYVKYDSEAELYYIAYGVGSSSGYIGDIETCIVELFRGDSSGVTQEYLDYISTLQIVTITSNGGGATHVARRTGTLASIGSSNLSDVLIVSGGGGSGLLVSETAYDGKDAGGISGSGDNSANQSTGNAFGLGESDSSASGGGGGLYGGYKGTSSKSGGAGSGYIGNSALTNKKMVGYNVPTSDAESTKTESVNIYSATGESNKPKAGGGHAKITFLREYDPSQEFREYIDIINGKNYFVKYHLADNWFTTVYETIQPPSWTWFTDDPAKYSFYAENASSLNPSKWNSDDSITQSYYVSDYIEEHATPYRQGSCIAYDMLAINIVKNGDTYTATNTESYSRSILTNRTLGATRRFTVRYNPTTGDNDFGGYQYSSVAQRLNWSYSSTSLHDVFKMLAMIFRNIDIYVNGSCWSKVSSSD